jgi:hypothetical protein
MPEEQDKKISYKILTAEEILKEETPPAKEIEHKEEKIEVPVVQKIEGSERTPVEEVKEKREVVQVQEEAGLISPEEVIAEPITQIEIPIPKPKETPPSEIKPIKEELPKEEIFYTPQKEIPFKPKPEPKLPTNLLRFVLLGGGVILIFLLIFFLKPQEKFKAIFKSKEEAKITATKESVISFPTISTITPEEKEMAKNLPKAIPEIPTQPSVPYQLAFSQEIKFLSNFPSKEIALKNLDFSSWQEEFKNFLSLQEYFGTKIHINFLYNKNKVPFDFLFDYFIKPTKISTDKIEEFKNNFTKNYGFLIYYGYTRKYPVLIFEVKDKEKALRFNEEWEKLRMEEDLKTLFLGLEPPKTKNNFVTKQHGNYSYRILDLGDNFKIIWTLADNYLIYSTTEMGLKDILDFLQ